MKKQHAKVERFHDVDELIKRIEEESPERGDYLYDYRLQQALKEKNQYDDESFSKRFKIDFFDLPISQASKRGLKQRKFIKMTEIQRCVLPQALAGRDILGASKTGSGKTLCYLIPLIELLYRHLWTPLDGLGGIIILPTRELAIQVFEVFNSFTSEHILSVGLLIGGKDVEYEKQRIHNMNVLICTPGRLLQHMEQTPGFDANNLKMLIIDEADTVLEMGFWEALRTILQYIPAERQTLLFSATLSKDIHQLSKLSLNQPELILLHNTQEGQQSLENMYETPSNLKQHYMVIKPDEKLDVLFSFIKTHLRDKILVFFSSCKQVRFVYETFRKLRIGTPVFELHGRQKQNKRMAIYFTFVENKFTTLFTTNVAARGLDFPKVDWVIQVDCPEDIQTYIHRIGRTARYKAGGSSLMLLMENETAIIDKLAKKRIPIKQIHLNPQKQLTIRHTVQSIVTEDKDLKYLAQRAVVTYMRSVYLSQDAESFQFLKDHASDIAESYGLVQIPVIKFKTNEPQKDEEEEEQARPPKKNKLQKLKEKIEKKKQQKFGASLQDTTDLKHLKTVSREVDTDRFDRLREAPQMQQDDSLAGGLFVRKGTIKPIAEKPKLIVSNRQLKKIKPDGHFGGRNKIVFAKDGKPLTVDEHRRQLLLEQQETIDKELDMTGELYQKLDMNAQQDKQNEMQRRKAKRLKRKAQTQRPLESDVEVQLGEDSDE